MDRHKTAVMSFSLLYLLFLHALPSVCRAFPSVSKIGDSTVDSQAMTLTGGTYGYAINGLAFQQEALVTCSGWQYIAYYNSAGHVCVTRRQLPAGAWEKIELTDYTISTTTDAHNVVSMGICPRDGTIHLSFDHHVSTLHYRRSASGAATNPASVTWGAALFGPVRNYLESGKPLSSFTYPQLWQTPDGNLQICYRIGSSGAGDLYIADYDGADGLWKTSRMVIARGGGTYTDQFGSSMDRNAYQNNTCYGPDGVLHLTWCWRETSSGYANHDILYIYSRDGGVTWYNNNLPGGLRIGANTDPPQTILDISWLSEGWQIVGQSTGNPATQQLVYLNSPGIVVVPIDRYYGLMNTQAQAVDPQGRVHVVMWHCTPETYQGYSWSTWGPPGARRYFHYWRDTAGNWHRNELPGSVGTRPRMLIRPNGDAFVIYNRGDLTIQAAAAANQWADWQIIHVEPGDFLGEPLADPCRFEDGVLSVMMQNNFSTPGQPTPLRVLDFQVNQ